METSVADWLKANAAAGQKIGYDPWLMTRAQVRQIAKGLEAAGAELVPVEQNPRRRDLERPARAAARAGVASSRKSSPASRSPKRSPRSQQRGREARRRRDPDRSRPSIAWLFNIRGGDLSHTPFPLSFAAVHADGRPELFIDGRKLSNAVRDRLETFADVREARDFSARLTELGKRGAKGPLRPERLGGGGGAAGRGGGRHDRRGRRSGRAAEGEEERRGARRLARRASSRRRRHAALPALHRGEPAGLADRDRRGEEARGVPRRDRGGRRHAARRHLLRVDLLHRPERRDQPLSRHREDQPAARGRRALSDRFRRPVSRRHHRHHPHRADRRRRRASGSTSFATASRAC